MPVEFFQQSAPQASGPLNSDYAKQLAQILMKGPGQGKGTPGGAPGQMVNGQYVPPSAVEYGTQLAGAALKGYQGMQDQEAQRIWSILNSPPSPNAGGA